MTDQQKNGAMTPRHSHAQQRAHILARLRSFGPSFDHELIAEGWTADPAARVAELCAEGYHIEKLRTYRPAPDGHRAWTVLYVMRVKHPETGAVIAAPAPLGVGAMLEQWMA